MRGYLQAFLVAIFITTFIGTTIGVAGPSMAPTLNGGVESVRSAGDYLKAALWGDRLFVPKYETWLRRAGLMPGYERGEIIIFREYPDSPCRSTARPALLVKRVIGAPGDTVRLRDGEVYINGARLDQSFITEAGGSLGHATMSELKVPEGYYFVLGDNREHSCDSRVYGPIPFMRVTGRATAVIWPPRRDGTWNWRRLTPPPAFAALPPPASSHEKPTPQPGQGVRTDVTGTRVDMVGTSRRADAFRSP